jgi:hypothetical protein
MNKMRSIKASLAASIDELIAGSTYVQSSIGPNEELLLLSFDRPFPYDRSKASPPSGPLVYKIHRLGPAGWELAHTLGPSGKRYSFAQPLPAGHWLLVEGRAGKGHDANADIIGDTGAILSSFHAGDGIEHVQTTAGGDIWIGYFDEGVFGGGELGQSGLVCLSKKGEPLLQYWSDIAVPNALPRIDDCYALNVSGEDVVWTAYYSDFPVVRLQGRILNKAWLEFPAKAVKSFAVSDDRLLMIPAYHKEGPLYYVDLKNSSLEEIQVLSPLGNPLTFDSSFGRGPLLCLASLKNADNRALYTVDLRAL